VITQTAGPDTPVVTDSRGLQKVPAFIEVVVLTDVVVLAVNLLAYVIGRATGAAFTYTHAGRVTRVDAASVAIMSVVPLTIGLTLIAWLSRRWSGLIRIAKVVASLLAVSTVGLMTIPAGFDATSAAFLATMHLALVPAALLALEALSPALRPARGTPWPRR
jgi:hypothetical protein